LPLSSQSQRNRIALNLTIEGHGSPWPFYFSGNPEITAPTAVSPMGLIGTTFQTLRLRRKEKADPAGSAFPMLKLEI
jgi:hypothetical protein